jgi:hypothetical protein
MIKSKLYFDKLETEHTIEDVDKPYIDWIGDMIATCEICGLKKQYCRQFHVCKKCQDLPEEIELLKSKIISLKSSMEQAYNLLKKCGDDGKIEDWPEYVGEAMGTLNRRFLI